MNFLKESSLDQRPGSDLLKECLWSGYIAFAGGKLCRSYSLKIFVLCRAPAHSYLITAKPAPPMANASALV